MKKIEIRRMKGGFHLIVDDAHGSSGELVTNLPDLLSVIAKEYGHIGRVWLEPVWMLMVRPAVRWGIRVGAMLEGWGDAMHRGWGKGQRKSKGKGQ